MKKVYGYIRVSTNNQVENGMSLDDQKRQIELYGEVHKLKLDKVFTERGVSGGVEFYKRPAGKKLMEVLQDGDVVICSKLDRMFRSCLDGLTVLKELKSRDIQLHFIDLGGNTTTNGIGQLMFTIMSSFAEMERNRLGERIKGTKQLQNKEDLFLGGKVGFGYVLEQHGEKQYLVEDKDEQKVIKKMKKLRNEG
ncbi:MAG: recombinase family protein, partial [Nitrospinaceae bacterium]|nr:recombinase family protein [Nitrospinaceae bacterium]